MRFCSAYAYRMYSYFRIPIQLANTGSRILKFEFVGDGGGGKPAPPKSPKVGGFKNGAEDTPIRNRSYILLRLFFYAIFREQKMPFRNGEYISPKNPGSATV